MELLKLTEVILLLLSLLVMLLLLVLKLVTMILWNVDDQLGVCRFEKQAEANQETTWATQNSAHHDHTSNDKLCPYTTVAAILPESGSGLEQMFNLQYYRIAMRQTSSKI